MRACFFEFVKPPFGKGAVVIDPAFIIGRQADDFFKTGFRLFQITQIVLEQYGDRVHEGFLTTFVKNFGPYDAAAVRRAVELHIHDGSILSGRRAGAWPPTTADLEAQLELTDGAADVAGDQVQNALGLRGERTNTQIVAHHEGGDLTPPA